MTKRELYDFIINTCDEFDAFPTITGDVNTWGASAHQALFDSYRHADDKDTKERIRQATIAIHNACREFISEEPKIVGTTTVEKSLEKFLLDNCPELKKKLQALEIIKKSISDKTSLDLLLRELLCFGKITQGEFDLLEEVLK